MLKKVHREAKLLPRPPRQPPSGSPLRKGSCGKPTSSPHKTIGLEMFPTRTPGAGREQGFRISGLRSARQLVEDGNLSKQVCFCEDAGQRPVFHQAEVDSLQFKCLVISWSCDCAHGAHVHKCAQRRTGGTTTCAGSSKTAPTVKSNIPVSICPDYCT